MLTCFLLCLLITWKAQGQLETTEEGDLQSNVTVQYVKVIVPHEDLDDYQFHFKLSNGEEFSRGGKLREVKGKKTVVLNGYVTEFIDGKQYQLRYAADENGNDVVVASKEQVSKLDRSLLPLVIRKPNQQEGASGADKFPMGVLHATTRKPFALPPPPTTRSRRPLVRPQQPNILLKDPSGDIILKPRTPTSEGSTSQGAVQTDAPAPAELLSTLAVISNMLASLVRNMFPSHSSDNSQNPESKPQVDSDVMQPPQCTPSSAGCIPNMDKIFEELMTKYDKKIRPDIYQEPTQVWADFQIRSLLGFNEVDMQFKLSIALALDWTDERLKVDRYNYPSDYAFPRRVLVDENQAGSLWTPRVTVLNEQESVEHSDIFDKGSMFWDPDHGGLTLTKYGILTLTCEMSLQNFPMDTQLCGIMIGSNSYGSAEVGLAGNMALGPLFSNSVKNMKLAAYEAHRIVQSSKGPRPVNQNILVCNLLMKRHVGYYLIGTYFPAALVVIISWLTFWMPREGSAERMALGVTCVLTITTLLISAQSSSPKVSYVKAIDVYMGVCFGLVFTTLLQSTLIGHWLRKGIILDGTRGNRVSAGGPERSTELASAVKRVMAGGIEMNYEAKILKQAKMSDFWSRALFPLLFVVFNVAYWTFYLTVWDDFDERMDWNWNVPNATEIPIIVGNWF